MKVATLLTKQKSIHNFMNNLKSERNNAFNYCPLNTAQDQQLYVSKQD